MTTENCKAGATQVLLVEDNPADAYMVGKFLQMGQPGSGGTEGKRTFELTVVESLADCLRALGGARPDVVLLDLSLPDGRNLEAFSTVYQACGSVPILLLTGMDENPQAVLMVKGGAQDYLVKGQFDGRLLQRAIGYAIERQRLVVELRQAAAEISTLHGLLPICAGCKKIRDGGGNWQHVEAYIQARADVKFTHGFCPDCIRERYPEIAGEMGL